MENLEFDQSNTSEFDQNASQIISEAFISEFSGLCIVENGKFRGEKNILRDFREIRVFDLTQPNRVFGLQFTQTNKKIGSLFWML